MAKNNTSVEYYPDENAEFEDYENKDAGDNESIVPDSDPDLLDIEVPGGDLVKFPVTILNFGRNSMLVELTLSIMLLLLPM